MKLQFEYFYGSEAEDFTFYRIPKKIITSPYFKDVSYGAKMLYGLLFDRVGLSIMNSWFDEENRAFIIFSIQEIMESMYCSKPTAIKFMSELEDVGIIERKKRGRGLTDYIYIKKVVDDEKVVKNIDHKGLKEFTSEGQENEPKEVNNFNPNNTNINNNYFNDTYTIPPSKSREDYEEIIKENIEYDILKLDFKGEWLDNIIELMLDVLCSDSKTVRVNQTNMPIDQVRKRYLSINDMHIRYLDDFVRKTEEIVPMNIKELKPYAEQPFKVQLDNSMDELCKSIAQNGVLSPIIARPHPEGGYEILSGHRRVKACELLRIEEVPVVVKNLDDDTAAILLVDSNLQRENILPSEKAFAYKLKLEAMKRKAGRPSKENPRQFVGNLESADILGKETGESGRQVQRYIRLTNLIDPLLDLVDKNEMALSAGVELSYLGTKHQAEIYKVIGSESPPSIAQAVKLRKAAEEGVLDDKIIESILSSEKEEKVKLVIYENKLRRYFPKNYTKEQIEDTVMKLIQKWHKNREKENER